ncbi:MAG: amino acid ABC transporter permease [Candidatus Aerophobetes bacterium]|nr:amino acid ABC transporter permease [Candidatus Aerophobetes bacterium]
MMEDVAMLYQALPYLLKGSIVTIELVAGALGVGLVMGIPMAVGQVYGSKPVSKIISFYVWFFRGLPVLVLLFIFYFGLFPLLNLDLSAFTAAVLVLGLRSAAYQSQIFRGSIQSLGSGQMLAARSIGMSRFKAISHIILPQALRISIPGWSNEYSIILKDSAITYALGVMEILTRGHFIATRTYKPMPVFLTCAVIFLILTYGGVKFLELLEKKVRIPGYGGGR